MTLIDTSAWIEYLRDTGSPVCRRVEELLEAETTTCDAIRMELLAGARDEAHLNDLRRLVARSQTVPIEPIDYEEAAALYRRCRHGGETVRKIIDCLIAAVAIRFGLPLLQRDGDFETLARHTSLKVIKLT